MYGVLYTIWQHTLCPNVSLRRLQICNIDLTSTVIAITKLQPLICLFIVCCSLTYSISYIQCTSQRKQKLYFLVYCISRSVSRYAITWTCSCRGGALYSLHIFAYSPLYTVFGCVICMFMATRDASGLSQEIIIPHGSYMHVPADVHYLLRAPFLS